MLFIPLYFQVSSNSSPGEAGAYMIPSILGNTAGGLVTGALIKRYGRYKLLTVLSSVSAGLCFTLLMIFWRGSTPVWQSLFVFPGGLATGIAHSSVFVALAAGVGEKEMAIAGSGLYLCGSIGAVAGMSAASAAFQTTLRVALEKALDRSDIPNGREVSTYHGSHLAFVQRLIMDRPNLSFLANESPPSDCTQGFV